MVSRLHLEVGHSDARGMIDLLRRKHAHRLIIATANKFSCCVCDESQRRRLHPMLNLHVLGTIMVGAGSRASSVSIRRVMDTEQGLGNVTGEITLNTLLNHRIQALSEPIQKEPFEIRGFDVVLLPRASVLTLLLEARPAKQECLGERWIPSNRQQYVWLEELLTV